MKICLVAGGTGGHIYPALALAQALRDQDSSNEIFFIGNKEESDIAFEGNGLFDISAPQNQYGDRLSDNLNH